MAIRCPFYSGKEACFQGVGFHEFTGVFIPWQMSSGLKNPKSGRGFNCLLSIPDDDRRGEQDQEISDYDRGAAFRDCSGVFMKSISERRLGDHTNFWNVKGTAE